MDNTIETLNKVLELHEKMKGAYFYNPPTKASSRRYYEECNSLTSEFEYKGDVYKIQQETSCSCKNIYYKIRYYKNGEPFDKDIRFIKKVLKELHTMN